jgi:hypothetical protein
MNVLVIPEDFPLDWHIVKPMIESMLRHLGQRKAKVEVCSNPRLQGVDEALKWERIRQILEMNRGYTDLFILIVDRDGDANRQKRLRWIEEQAGDFLSDDQILLAENAWQEIEVWLLAGQKDLPSHWDWKAIRGEVSAKEVYFRPYVRERGLHMSPTKGHRELAVVAARQYRRVRKLCPEDVLNLENRIAAWLTRGT